MDCRELIKPKAKKVCAALALLAFAAARARAQAPVISALVPDFAPAGSGWTLLTVDGSNFTQYEAHIFWNGVKMNQTRKSASQIVTWISPSQLATAGVAKVQVVNTTTGQGSNVADFTITGSGIAPPTAPVLDSATVASSSQIDLAWTNTANDAGGNRILRCAGSGCVPSTVVASVSGSATSYNDSGLAASISYTYIVQAFNSGGSADSNALSATTLAAPLTVTTTSLPGGTEGSAYSTQLQANGGKSPYSWIMVSGSLPGGLALSASGAIAGTPTSSGAFAFFVQVTDSAGDKADAAGLSITISPIGISAAKHYLYAFPPGYVYVYDMDNGFAQVKKVVLPNTANIGNANVRGAVASAATNMLYISYDPSGVCCGHGHLVKYDLLTDTVAWDVSYSAQNIGSDSQAISPDGKTIYMPDGESTSNGLWYVISAADGSVLRTINSGGSGPHNTAVNPAGTHVYMAPRYSAYLVEADAATGTVLKDIGPNHSSTVRPFVVDPTETYAFMTPSDAVGFTVASVATGAVLYPLVVPPGFSWSGSFNSASGVSHGIALSLDNTRLFLIDYPHNHVHVFDISKLPGSAPTDVADIALKCSMTAEGWLERSQDGRFVSVGDCGDIISTSTYTVVANAAQLKNTRIFQEVDFESGAVSATPTERNY